MPVPEAVRNFDYPEPVLIIGDAEIRRTSDDGGLVLNPATGASIARTPAVTEAQIDTALAAASTAFDGWQRTSAVDRGRVLRGAADGLRRDVERLARTMTLEQGKPLAESRSEVLAAADVFEWYGEEGRRTYGRIVPSRTPGLRHHVNREPVGVVAAFTPWNFPALTPARKIAGALAAGCTIIIKPAEETPGTALALARGLIDAGLPPGALNIVFGDPATISARLVTAPEVRKVSFTGSTAVGKHLARLAADGVKRITLELGGHAPVLVMADADAGRVGAACAASKFRNAGQVCISPTRFYVQRPVYEDFVAGFVEAARGLTLGDGLVDGTTMGPLANARRLEAARRLTADAMAKGARLMTGGERQDSAGFFFNPTVLAETPPGAAIMTEEPFGPVAPIAVFDDPGEAIRAANAVPFGLSAYVFTNDLGLAHRLSDALEAGMVGVNTFAISQAETPFGGVKESGYGSEGGVEGLEAYLRTKLVSMT